MRHQVDNPERVAKRAFFLAYQACGGTSGMGFLQDRSGVTEEDVWKNVATRGDYPNGGRPTEVNNPHGDYVFGRMMKLGMTLGSDYVEVSDNVPKPDYQGWSGRTYPTYDALIVAAIASVAKSG